MNTEEQALKERYRIASLVTVVGAIVNIVLAILKIIFGIVGHSHALLVDGIHSFSDLLSDALVVLATRHGSKSPDEDHPYGHARIETAGAAVFGGVLITVGLGIAIDAMEKLTSGEVIVPDSVTLWVAVLSIFSKEFLYHYTLHYAKQLNSTILKANAWHHRSDAVSSIVVLVGIVGSLLGVPYFDIAAAIIVSMMIVKIGWDIGKESFEELVDKGLDQEKVKHISQHISTIPGVSQMHMLRSRQMGADTLLDVHVQVAPQLSVSEGHRISDEVSKHLTQAFPDITQVLVHIDPEDDEKQSSCSHLPLRESILADLNQQWGQNDEAKCIEQVTLHYLDGKVSIQIIMPLSILSSIDDSILLQNKLATAVEKLDYIDKIELLYR